MDQQITLNIWQLIVGVGTILLTGGALTLGTVALVARTLRTDLTLMRAIEGLMTSVPTDALPKVNAIGTGLREVGALLEEASDGIPVDSKPRV